MVGFNRRPPPDIFVDVRHSFRFALCQECARDFPVQDRCGLCALPTYDPCTPIGHYHVCTPCVAVLADYVRVSREGDLSLSPDFRRWINDLANGMPVEGALFPESARVIAGYLHDRSARPTLHEMQCIPARARLRAMGVPDYLGSRVVACIGPERVGPDVLSVIHELVNKCQNALYSDERKETAVVHGGLECFCLVQRYRRRESPSMK